jgi:hypothetical protein
MYACSFVSDNARVIYLNQGNVYKSLIVVDRPKRVSFYQVFYQTFKYAILTVLINSVCKMLVGDNL